MGASRAARAVRASAHAKINLTLRVLGVRSDGYHALRTTFQTLALHDTLTFRFERGPFVLEATDPSCPVDETNLVWRAAERIWKAAGRRGGPHGVRIRLTKRIPVQAGLGGGSSDAATALRVLAEGWRAALAPGRLHEIAASLGADVPFFLRGGTALGLGRGDLIYQLPDLPATWVTVVVPPFGVSTVDAYRWWDETGPDTNEQRPASLRDVGRAPWTTWLPAADLANDLQGPVSAHHPEIGRLAAALRRAGAAYAAMSGSGSAVFALFAGRRAAVAAARALDRGGRRTLVTRTRRRTGR